jgi:Na+/glutamate symporter
LKEVKVPEPFLGGIVGFSLFPTYRATEHTTLREIDEDVNRTFILVEFNFRNLPGWIQL